MSDAAPAPYRCRDCGEVFAEPVWHCVECGHHWPRHRDVCWNCHLGRDGKPVDHLDDEGAA